MELRDVVFAFAFVASATVTSAAAQERSASPAVAALAASVQSGDASAEAGFWTRMERMGTPLVEHIPNDSTHVLVTVLLRAGADTKNAIVISPLSLIDFSASIMERIEGTNTWHRTYRLPRSTRFLYRFGIDDTLIPFEQDRAFFERMRTWQPDPHNRRTFRYEDGSEASVLELTPPPSAAWLVPRNGATGGVLRAEMLRSEVLGRGRQIRVYTPAGYSRDGDSYPLLIFHDGASYLDPIPTPTLLDNLIRDGLIPPVVAVFVDADANARSDEYNCGATWSRFLAEELVPHIRQNFNAGAEALRTIVAGFSLGGLAAACAAIMHSDVFGGVLAQSGSFFRAPDEEEPEWLARSLAARAALPVRWHLEIGSLERGAIPSRDPSMLTANRHVRDVLRARNYTLRYHEYAGGHEHIAWRANLAPALIWMLNP